MELLTVTEKILHLSYSEYKNELGRGIERNQFINKIINRNLVEGFSNDHDFNSRFIFLHEALVDKFTYSPKIVLSRVFGPKPKLFVYN